MRWVLGVAGMLLVVVLLGRCSPTMRVATFNIRMFPQPTTDLARVAETLVQLDADIIAVQEIVSERALREVLRQASASSGRDYRAVLSRCRHPRHGLTTGVVWDASRWHLVEHRDYPQLRPDGNGTCGRTQPGLLGVFDGPDEQAVAVLSVHLDAHPHGFAARREQWRKVIAIQTALREELGRPVLALGDFNSTGFTTAPPEEPAFVRQRVQEAGLQLLTDDIACTEYYRPPGSDAYLPSILDHIVATDGRWSPAYALGLCARLSCDVTPPPDMDPDYSAVSDHCPVVIDGTPRP